MATTCSCLVNTLFTDVRRLCGRNRQNRRVCAAQDDGSLFSILFFAFYNQQSFLVFFCFCSFMTDTTFCIVSSVRLH